MTATLSLARACAPRATRASDDVELEAEALMSSGWADKPKGLGFTPDEQAIADALLSDWSERLKIEPDHFEWSWTSNTLGRRWIVVQVVGGRRFLNTRGFTEESLRAYLKRLRSSGCVVREAARQKAAA